jgi:hypothetical protein
MGRISRAPLGNFANSPDRDAAYARSEAACQEAGLLLISIVFHRFKVT